jgi:AraC-like DNA-binding protein
MEGFLVTDIASLVGFSDPYYFSKCFKKVVGISPSQYRTLALKDQEQRPSD